MAKKIGIDFGLKRTGLSMTDSSNIIASPLTTVDSIHLMNFLKQLVEKEQIDTIVLGEPKRLNNAATHITENVKLLQQALMKSFPEIEIVLLDERYTSKLAMQSIHSMGLKKNKREDKGLVDQISATLILQSYLERLQFLK